MQQIIWTQDLHQQLSAMDRETDEGLALIMDTFMWMRNNRQQAEKNSVDRARANAPHARGRKGGMGVNTWKRERGVVDSEYPGTVTVEGSNG